MTTTATYKTGALARSDVISCISRLRAFAVLLAGDRQRADDLVRETIVQTFTAVKRPHDGISLLVRMFTALRRLHYGALRQSMDVARRGSRSCRQPRATALGPTNSYAFSVGFATSSVKR